MLKVLKVALNLDLILLRAAWVCVGACEEWISLPQARVEHLLALAWLATETAGVLQWHGLLRGVGLAMVPLNLLWAVARVSRTSAERKVLIALESQIGLRVCLLTLNVLDILISAATHTLDFVDLSGVALVAFIFVTALPQDADRLGRKRKLALAKLKHCMQRRPSAWVPEPSAGAA